MPSEVRGRDDHAGGGGEATGLVASEAEESVTETAEDSRRKTAGRAWKAGGSGRGGSVGGATDVALGGGGGGRLVGIGGGRSVNTVEASEGVDVGRGVIGVLAVDKTESFLLIDPSDRLACTAAPGGGGGAFFFGATGVVGFSGVFWIISRTAWATSAFAAA